MTWIRRLAIALGALLLLLAAAAAVLVATFDANRYKTLAIDWMASERQRTLAIDGPIELSVFPRLAVKASRLRLSERGRSAEFVAIDEAALAVQVLPLLRKQLVIDRVSARGVRAAFSRDAKGLRNVDDLFGAPARGPAGAATGDGSPALRLDVSAVQLDDVQLRVRDEIANLAGEVLLQSLRTGRLADDAETPVAVQANVRLTRPHALSLALDGRATLRLDFDKPMATATNLRLELQGDGGGVKALAATLNAKSLVYSAGEGRVEFEALKLAVSGKPAAGAFELVLDWPQLAAHGDQVKGSAMSGSFKLSGASTLAGSLRSAAPSGSFEALRLPGVALTLSGTAGPRRIEGKAAADLLLRLDRGAVAVERLDATASLLDPSLAPLQIALRGSAGIDGQAAQWQLDGALNDNRFASKGNAVFGGAVPRLNASARFDSLDINRLLAPAGQPAPRAAAPATSPVALDGLRAVNGQFGVSAGALAIRQYRVGDARVDAALDNGTLRITRLTGRAWGGSVDASGSADARSQRLTVKLAATGVDVNALLRDVAGKDLVAGSGRVVADLATSGASLGALRSNLAGTAALQLRDGAIKGVNLARSLRQARAALSGKQDAVTKARETEKTDFSELNMSARIAAGVAHSDDLDLKSPFLRIGGAGRLDIGRGTIDYTARAAVVALPAGQDAGDLAALRGVTVPVRLTGPFDAIAWNIEWSGVAAAAVESRLKDKLAAKLAGALGAGPGAASSAATTPQDRLKDKLKGLFK